MTGAEKTRLPVRLGVVISQPEGDVVKSENRRVYDKAPYGTVADQAAVSPDSKPSVKIGLGLATRSK